MWVSLGWLMRILRGLCSSGGLLEFSVIFNICLNQNMRKRSYVSHLCCQIYVGVGHRVSPVLLVALRLFLFVEDQIESGSFCRVVFVFGGGCLPQIEQSSLVDQSSNQTGAFVFAQDIFAVHIARKRWGADGWFGGGQLPCFDVEGVAFCEIVHSNVPHLEVFAGDFVGVGDISDEDSVVAVDCSHSIFVEETGLLVDSNSDWRLQFSQNWNESAQPSSAVEMGVDLEISHKAESVKLRSVLLVLQAISAVSEIIETSSVGDRIGGKSHRIGKVQNAEGRSSAIDYLGIDCSSSGDSHHDDVVLQHSIPEN